MRWMVIYEYEVPGEEDCANSKIIQNYYENNMQRFYNVTNGGINNHVICGFHDVCISDDIRLNLTVELLLH
jgi:hypothetical protein